MNPKRKAVLVHKGWGEKEIRHAEAVLERADRYDIFFSRMVFWSALLVIIFANLIVSLILIPFLIALEGWILYSAIILLGMMVGFVYNFLITDVSHLERKHHIWAGILVPLIAVLNMVGMVLVSNKVVAGLPIEITPNNPWIVAGVFVLAFVTPYIIDSILHFTRVGSSP